MSGASWLCLATTRGCQSRAAGHPSASRKPGRKHLDRKPVCWPAETALVSLVSEGLASGQRKVSQVLRAAPMGPQTPPLSLGCGFKGVSRKASSKLGQRRCFLEEGRGSREHNVYQAWASWLMLRCDPFVLAPGTIGLMVQSSSANPGWLPFLGSLYIWERTLQSHGVGMSTCSWLPG